MRRLTAAGLLIVFVVLAVGYLARRRAVIQGAIVTGDTNPANQLPIANVDVSIDGAPLVASVRSDVAGYFRIRVPWRMRAGQSITLTFRHSGFQTLSMRHVSSGRLYVAHLVREVAPEPVSVRGNNVAIADVVVRYSIRSTSLINIIGSAVKTFQVTNRGNIPCDRRRPCSPDGEWRAAENSATLDARAGNEFQNPRVSCIAGPCPFTKILGDGVTLSRDRRTVQVSALDWSDTATFLLEAEVYKPVVSDLVRQTYPVIFDRALTFTLPPAAQGVSIQAQLNGATIVFPALSENLTEARITRLSRFCVRRGVPDC
jgi:hypothetical protein